MKKRCIVFTSSNDVHADRLITKMRPTTDIIRLDLDRVHEWALSFCNNEVILTIKNTVHVLEHSDSVFVRRLPSYEPFVRSVPAVYESNSEFIAQQKFLLFNDCLAILDRTSKFVNPLNSSSTHGKAVQAMVAAEVGLVTPETYIGASPEMATRFLTDIFESGRRASTKPIANVKTNIDGKEVTRFTELIGEKDLPALATLNLCPVIFQEYVEKRYEIRGAIVGDHVLATQILSQEAGSKTAIDWRRYDIPKTPHYQYKLPQEIENKLIQLHKKLGLLYSSFDLIRSADGEYVFLETNPYGQWLWIEDLTGLQVTQAIADYLQT